MAQRRRKSRKSRRTTGSSKRRKSSHKGVPFVNRYDHDGDYEWNGNNYLDEESYRLASSA